MHDILAMVEEIHRQADLLTSQWQRIDRLIKDLEIAESALREACRQACCEALDALGKFNPGR
jgi:prefoldin subunit 5